MIINFGDREVKLNNRKDIVVYAIWVGSYVYLGSGKAERLQGNCSKLRRNVHSNKTLQDEYNKIQDVKVELLAICSDDIIARDEEEKFIQYFKKVDGVIVCNVRKASNGATSEAYNKYKRLCREDVAKIKALLDEYDNKRLAEMFNCSTNAISKIRCGKRWTNI